MPAEIEEARERGVVELVRSVLAAIDLLGEVVPDHAIGGREALTALAALVLDRHARRVDVDEPRVGALLDRVTRGRGRAFAADLGDPRVVRRGDLAARAVLLAQRERERDGVVAELLPAVRERRTRAVRDELARCFELDRRRVRQGVRAAHATAHGIAGVDEVGEALGLEQLLTGLEGLAAGDLGQRFGLDERKEAFDLSHMPPRPSGLSRVGRAPRSHPLRSPLPPSRTGAGGSPASNSAAHHHS